MKKIFFYISTFSVLLFSACEIVQAESTYDNGYVQPIDYRNENYYAPPILTANIDGENVVICDTNPGYSGSYESIGGTLDDYSGYYSTTGTWNWHAYGTIVSNTINSRTFALKTGIIAYPFYSFGGSNVITASTFFNYFKTGLNQFQYASAAINPFNGTNVNSYQVSLAYTDENGTTWKTVSGSQTGSTFQFSDTLRYTDYAFDNCYKVKYKARFNCKLYNSTGQSKNLTNGLLIGEFYADVP